MNQKHHLEKHGEKIVGVLVLGILVELLMLFAGVKSNTTELLKIEGYAFVESVFIMVIFLLYFFLLLKKERIIII